MENHEQNVNPEEQTVLPAQEEYKPRPAWQVWSARIALAVFIVVLIVYYMVFFRGGR